MADPVTTGLIIAATTLVGGATSYAGAKQQNDAARRAARSTREAAEINAGQVRQRSAQEQREQRSQAARIRALIRVRAAEQGADLDSGSYAALENQAGIDEAENIQTIRRNAANQILSIASGGNARLEEIEGSRRNLLLDAFMGGVQGAGTGLSIDSSVTDLRRRNTT